MLEFHPLIFAIQAATFLLGMWAIWMLYLKPLGKHIRERSQGIAKAIEDSQLAREEAEKLKASVVKEIEDLRNKEKQILEQAREEGNRLREQLLAQARAEQEALLEKARLQIEQETRLARQELRRETASLVVQATRKLLSKNLDRKTQVDLVDRFIKQIPEEARK